MTQGKNTNKRRGRKNEVRKYAYLKAQENWTETKELFEF